MKKKAPKRAAKRKTRSGQSLLGSGLAGGAAKNIRKYRQRLKNI